MCVSVCVERETVWMREREWISERVNERERESEGERVNEREREWMRERHRYTFKMSTITSFKILLSLNNLK